MKGYYEDGNRSIVGLGSGDSVTAPNRHLPAMVVSNPNGHGYDDLLYWKSSADGDSFTLKVQKYGRQRNRP